jgi:hypothetical protein
LWRIATALHTGLWAAVTPLTAAPAVDPFAFICQSAFPGGGKPILLDTPIVIVR